MSITVRWAFLVIMIFPVWIALELAPPLSHAQSEDRPGEGAADIREMRRLAEQGDVHAQLRLGSMYFTGEGVSENQAEAVKWFRMAAEQGHADAKMVLRAISETNPDESGCDVSGKIPEGHLFIGYTRASESTLRALALFDEDAGLIPYDGENLAPGQTLYGLLDSSKAVIDKVEPYLNHFGINHCEYPATLSSPSTASWRIWASGLELRNRLRRPIPDEKSRFREHAMECIVQGDPPEGTPCVRPELIAVSDLNGNGKLEYWHTEPFFWETGFQVTEEGASRPMLSACPGCAD